MNTLDSETSTRDDWPQEPCAYSDTPETDRIVSIEGNWYTKALRMMHHAKRLERERNTARIPICVGRHIIETLADEGMCMFKNGTSAIAASDLFHKNPYQENS